MFVDMFVHVFSGNATSVLLIKAKLSPIYICENDCGGQQAAHETSASKLNERASFEMMRPDAAVGSRFIYFSVKNGP